MSSPQLHIGRRSIIGNVYALTLICHDRHPRFADPEAAAIAMKTLNCMDADGLTASLAWVVMPDHIHWLAQLRGRPLGYCLQRFKARSSFLINRAQGQKGPVWQAGYYDHAVRSDESLRKQAMYILANPVRAGLAKTLGEYPNAWSYWPVGPEG